MTGFSVPGAALDCLVDDAFGCRRVSCEAGAAFSVSFWFGPEDGCSYTFLCLEHLDEIVELSHGPFMDMFGSTVWLYVSYVELP